MIEKLAKSRSSWVVPLVEGSGDLITNGKPLEFKECKNL
jgi:hypothetical protein